MHSNERCAGGFKRFYSRTRLTNASKDENAFEVMRCSGTFVERGSLHGTLPGKILLASRLRSKISGTWETSGCVGFFFVSAHLVIILGWESAHAGRNSGRKLKTNA